MQERFHPLDGLRGLAATIVLVAHGFQMLLPAAFSPGAAGQFGESALAMSPLNVLFNGGFAVCLFFVLSGFVLAMPWFARRDARWYAVAALKRYPRLALPAAASTLLAVVLAKTVGFHYAEARTITGATMTDFFSGIGDWSVALWQGAIGAFFFGDDSYNRVLWTIRVELIGSMGVFMLAPVLGRFRLRWIAYLALVAWLADTFYLGFVLGALIADLVATWRPRPLAASAWVPLTLVGLWLAAYPYSTVDGSIWAPIALALRGIGDPFMSSHTLGAACLLVVALQAPWASTALATGPLRYLGRSAGVGLAEGQ